MPVADSHTHLDLDAEVDQRELSQIVEDAARAGVELLVHIGTDVPSSEFGASLTQVNAAVRCAVGLHPNVAPELLDEHGENGLNRAIERIEQLATSPQVHALGETGLDHFRTKESGQASQEWSFREHIRIAKSVDKPLVVHDRDAHEQVARILGETNPSKVVLHCFSGDEQLAEEFVERGYYLSFAGNVTFKNSDDLRAALRKVPLSQLLVETDAPFLAPMPHRGKVNSSYLIPVIIRAISEIRGDSVIDVAQATWQNTVHLFGDLP